MKNLIIFLGILLAITTWISHADADNKALVIEKTGLLKNMDALEEEFNLNEAKVPGLTQRKSNLEWSAKQVKKSVDGWEAEKIQLQIRVGNYEQDVSSYNSRCNRTFDENNEYDQYLDCVNEKSRLDSNKSKLEGDLQYHTNQRAVVVELVENQNKQWNQLVEEINRYNAHRQELVDAGNKIQARIDQITPLLTDCENAIAYHDAKPSDARKERMKAVCGRMFDGN